ncbi:MAG: hypothetical protein HYU73_15120 [Betaproteobacteria bacterium]|nr:hypothetical protein [Betaproteobacteria bacterium]
MDDTIIHHRGHFSTALVNRNEVDFSISRITKPAPGFRRYGTSEGEVEYLYRQTAGRDEKPAEQVSMRRSSIYASLSSNRDGYFVEDYLIAEKA